LQHAYGSAADIPNLLRQLGTLPDCEGNEEPWYSLWSALAHQGDVFPASFAAVPHVVEALALAPRRAPATFFHFPAWVEVCRKIRGVTVPLDIEFDYFAALARLPSLVAAAATESWSDEFTVCALGAIAAVKGNAKVAQAIMELTPAEAERFLASLFV
jgi:hypothetical protein